MSLNGKTPDPDPGSKESQGEETKNPLQEGPVPGKWERKGSWRSTSRGKLARSWQKPLLRWAWGRGGPWRSLLHESREA